MGLYDHVAPSECAAELSLLVRRLRKHAQLKVVPMLVVEGAADKELFAGVCEPNDRHVFPAGTRNLVEELLRYLQTDPVPGCECVFLVDCDGRGKTTSLADEQHLLVTETCDIEADLVHLGVAQRVVRGFVPSDEAAIDLVERSCRLALQVSAVRRGAGRVRVSMKKGGRQLRLADLPELHLATWEAVTPARAEVCAVVGAELGWSDADTERVMTTSAEVPHDFRTVCMGKDALDAIHRALLREGSGNVRGWSLAHFHAVVRATLEPADFAAWEVGKRLRAWQHRTGHRLVKV